MHRHFSPSLPVSPSPRLSHPPPPIPRPHPAVRAWTVSRGRGRIGNALRSLPDPRGLRALAGDTAVACAKNVFRPEQIELNGGGGTDMAAMIVAACEERPSPKAILVVADGYTGWPPKPVGPRVVACLTQARTADSVPEWIDTVVRSSAD
ncbi:MAG: VWA-like domain-containing protein [Thermoguttaceae bacterium]